MPVVELALIRGDKRLRARGLAVVDTGFDGGVYPNLEVVEFLEGLTPLATERLETPLSKPVEFEVYELRGELISPRTNERLDLEEVKIYVPMEVEYLSREVLVGREILNKLKISLNGQYTEVST